MNELSFLDSFYQTDQSAETRNYLVSGVDPIIRDAFLKKFLKDSKTDGRITFILDDSDGTMISQNIILMNQVIIKDGLDDGNSLYNIFPLNVKRGWLQLRKVLDILGYSEEQKAKLIAFLDFVNTCESISGNKSSGDISLDTLGEYSSNVQVGMKISSLTAKGIIDDFQKEYLISKYSEGCSAGADFEHRLLMIEKLISGEPMSLQPDELILYKLSDYEGDSLMRRLTVSLILSFMREHKNEKFSVVVLDKGYGMRECLVDFMMSFPINVETLFLSTDVFTVCEREVLNPIFNRFPLKVFSRHLSKNSCEQIEKECGEIDVKKTSYSVTYDRRWSANKPMDVLLGNNRQDVFVLGPPIREPRYRKEMIASLYQGTGIAVYNGQTLLFSVDCFF